MNTLDKLRDILNTGETDEKTVLDMARDAHTAELKVARVIRILEDIDLEDLTKAERSILKILRDDRP